VFLNQVKFKALLHKFEADDTDNKMLKAKGKPKSASKSKKHDSDESMRAVVWYVVCGVGSREQEKKKEQLLWGSSEVAELQRGGAREQLLQTEETCLRRE
jgi:hypothetical protein